MIDRPKVYTVEFGECEQGDHAILGIFTTEAVARQWAIDQSDYRDPDIYRIREHVLDEASEFAIGLGRCPECGRDSVSGAKGAEYAAGIGFRPFVVYRHLDRMVGTVINHECRAYPPSGPFHKPLTSSPRRSGEA